MLNSTGECNTDKMITFIHFGGPRKTLWDAEILPVFLHLLRINMVCSIRKNRSLTSKPADRTVNIVCVILASE